MDANIDTALYVGRGLMFNVSFVIVLALEAWFWCLYLGSDSLRQNGDEINPTKRKTANFDFKRIGSYGKTATDWGRWLITIKSLIVIIWRF